MIKFMESGENSFPWLKFVLIALVVILLAAGGYFVVVSTSKPESTVVNDDSAIRLVKKTDKDIINKVYEYTSANLSSGQVIDLYGNFVAADAEERIIDGLKYVYVIGIENSDGSLTKVHLRADEYEQLGGSLSRNEFVRTFPVVVTITDHGIDIRNNK